MVKDKWNKEYSVPHDWEFYANNGICFVIKDGHLLTIEAIQKRSDRSYGRAAELSTFLSIPKDAVHTGIKKESIEGILGKLIDKFRDKYFFTEERTFNYFGEKVEKAEELYSDWR